MRTEYEEFAFAADNVLMFWPQRLHRNLELVPLSCTSMQKSAEWNFPYLRLPKPSTPYLHLRQSWRCLDGGVRDSRFHGTTLAKASTRITASKGQPPDFQRMHLKLHRQEVAASPTISRKHDSLTSSGRKWGFPKGTPFTAWLRPQFDRPKPKSIKGPVAF